MKLKVKKPLTITLQVGDVIETDIPNLSLIKDYVVIEEEEKKTRTRKKEA